ncbi:DUF2061 domain-containing protein [Azospirillum halopraeferens]|uniref:DUF2061 domain-containing protein n=1 Tax=Azospirillum halopraeferens TaxID=34010 RepID=UPI000429442C|nr:DUF2061 domain-containing protein [Azospirillum halopraeferens]
MTKTFSFACVHFTVAFTVAYALTGSVAIGGLVALVEPMVNTVAYHLHEKAWANWTARRAGPGRSAAPAPAGGMHAAAA